MDNIGLLIRKYSVPVLFTVIGLGVLIYGISNNQNGTFLFSAGMILAAGILSGLFSLGKLRPIVIMGIGGVFGIVAVILIYLSYDGVSQTLKYQEDRGLCLEMAKQNLSDIRFLQKVHKEQTGKYIDNWEDLIDFANNGTMPELVSRGSVPSDKITPEERDYLYNDNRPIDKNMTEEEAIKLSKWKEGPRYQQLFSGFVRDTNQVSIYETKFRNAAYVDSRVKNDLPKFSAKDLPYIPFTNMKEKWDMKVVDSVNINDVIDQAIYVGGAIPFAENDGSKKMIEINFGSTTSHDTEGSWEKD